MARDPLKGKVTPYVKPTKKQVNASRKNIEAVVKKRASRIDALHKGISEAVVELLDIRKEVTAVDPQGHAFSYEEPVTIAKMYELPFPFEEDLNDMLRYCTQSRERLKRIIAKKARKN